MAVSLAFTLTSLSLHFCFILSQKQIIIILNNLSDTAPRIAFLSWLLSLDVKVEGIPSKTVIPPLLYYLFVPMVCWCISPLHNSRKENMSIDSKVSVLLPLSLQWLIFVWLHLNLLFLPVWAIWFIFLTSSQFSSSLATELPLQSIKKSPYTFQWFFSNSISFFYQFLREKYSMDQWISKSGIWLWSKYMYLTPWGWTLYAPLLFSAFLLYQKQENKLIRIKSQINNRSVSCLKTLAA